MAYYITMNAMVTLNEFGELEDEVKQEFYSDVKDCLQDLKDCTQEMGDGESEELIHRMFRAIHTIKGNCNMVFLPMYVDALHFIEEMVQDVRNGAYPYNSAYATLFVSSCNRVVELLGDSIATGQADEKALSGIRQLIKEVREAGDERRPTIARCADSAIADGHYSLDLIAAADSEGSVFSIFDATDMEFFQYLIDCQSQMFPDVRSKVQNMIQLSLVLNESMGMAVDEEQLTAALYCFELSSLFGKAKTENEKDFAQRRIFTAGGLLSRMPGWNIAAEMIFQSQEKFDGTGFPKQLKDKDIVPGAQIIQLVSHFFDKIFSCRDLGYKKGLFAAVKAINEEAERIYSPKIIRIFNSVIKSHYLSRSQW
ncbi:HD domain-containing phosphohydrolase [Pleionea sp. CnH1-48]|uniref:HD domain-containing phosphohydrolase n=1 Tax=Pleionea sp. CnH1-48 TaxID=2954494 RepID=UPI00209732D9|nr:HD domain-containing phosphohydrolase [Pleionea sp. CnH1-48]MCO7226427.1 Hpt domain-containing protein [Pleionea sp. CnH1-48]